MILVVSLLLWKYCGNTHSFKKVLTCVSTTITPSSRVPCMWLIMCLCTLLRIWPKKTPQKTLDLPTEEETRLLHKPSVLRHNLNTRCLCFLWLGCDDSSDRLYSISRITHGWLPKAVCLKIKVRTCSETITTKLHRKNKYTREDFIMCVWTDQQRRII